MRQFLAGLSLSVAFIAGCVASQLAHVVVPPAHAGAPVQRWEYFCLEDMDPSGKARDLAKLNDAGREGWELVTQVGSNCCFKRPRS